MEDLLTITVSGQRKSAKSHLVFLLIKVLRNEGFNVHFTTNQDDPTEAYLEKRIANVGFNERIQFVKANYEIAVQENFKKNNSMKTHKVIDTHYSDDEGNVDFVGTFEECQNYIEDQSRYSTSNYFMLKIEELNKQERDLYFLTEEETTN